MLDGNALQEFNMYSGLPLSRTLYVHLNILQHLSIPPPSFCHETIQPHLSPAPSLPPLHLLICNITTSPPSSSVYHLLILSMLPHFLSLFIHRSVHLSIYPFISIAMWEVKWTHLMGLCVSSKWSARVSHWLSRWATRCCPRLLWCQRKCRISLEELGKKEVENTETRLAFQICNLWIIHCHLYIILH